MQLLIFHPPFKRFLPIQTFRWSVVAETYCWIFFSFTSVLTLSCKSNPKSRHSHPERLYVALLMAFCVTFPLGFLLSKYIVFQGHTYADNQLFRYGLIVAINLLLNYVLLNVMVHTPFYPLSKIFDCYYRHFQLPLSKTLTFRQSNTTSEATDNENLTILHPLSVGINLAFGFQIIKQKYLLCQRL